MGRRQPTAPARQRYTPGPKADRPRRTHDPVRADPAMPVCRTVQCRPGRRQLRPGGSGVRFPFPSSGMLAVDAPMPVCRTVQPPWSIAPGCGCALSAVPECWQWSLAYSALPIPSQSDHIFANPPDGRQHHPPLNRPAVALPASSARSASLAISRSAPFRHLRRTDAWPPESWCSGKPDQLHHHAIH